MDNEAHAATALDCAYCGHSAGDHEWDSHAAPRIIAVGRCGNQKRLPREGDEPKVRYDLCPCSEYHPKRILHGSTGEQEGGE